MSYHNYPPHTHPWSLLTLRFNCRSSPNRNLPLSGIISLHWRNFSTWLEAHKMRSVGPAASRGWGSVSLALQPQHRFNQLCSAFNAEKSRKADLFKPIAITGCEIFEGSVIRWIQMFFFLPPPPPSTHLHAGLGKVDFQRHFLAHEYIRVASFGEQRLQNVELCARKSSPLSSLLPRRCCGLKQMSGFFLCKFKKGAKFGLGLVGGFSAFFKSLWRRCCNYTTSMQHSQKCKFIVK